MEFKGLTVAEFIEILKMYPLDATIGVVDYMEDMMFGESTIEIIEHKDGIMCSKDNKCDYYIGY